MVPADDLPKGELRPGDIILFAGRSFSARLVNWFQALFAAGGESIYNHAALVISPQGHIFESVHWWPRVICLRHRYRRSRVLIVRWREMTLERCQQGLHEVAYLKDRLYPFWRQLFHALRLGRYVPGVDAVCSELVAKFLSAVGAWSRPWAGVNVNDLHEEFLRHPAQFQVIFQGRLKDFSF